MLRAKLCGLALAVMWPTAAFAETVTLRCPDRHAGNPADHITFSIALDPAQRKVLDIGYGQGVETTEFSETQIAAKQPVAGILASFQVDRVSGKFTYDWIVFGKDRKVDAKASRTFRGDCSATARKF
jgi:hypothetical protein